MSEPIQKKNEKMKKRSKKSSWYEVLYPTYKSRCTDFRQIFSNVIPNNDKLIADYACALQREILMQGRLYASINYICFYANLFRCETMVYIKWEDVREISREKTAFVIPNAIQIYTENEKIFLSSFISRDKTYNMLLRLWKNSLSDKPFSQTELSDLVHLCYGTDLGFSSDDEEVSATDETISRSKCETLSHSKSPDHDRMDDTNILRARTPPLEIAEEAYDANDQTIIEDKPNTGKNHGLENSMSKLSITNGFRRLISEEEAKTIVCPGPHNGRLLLQVVDLNLNVDVLFDTLFTESEFFLYLLAARKKTLLKLTAWKLNNDTKHKVRTVQTTLPVSGTLFKGTCNVEETQILSKISQSGKLYTIDVEVNNRGIPYGEAFYVDLHYCLQRKSSNISSISVHGQIFYRKPIWGFIKNIIEKNAWAGIEDNFKLMASGLKKYSKTWHEQNQTNHNQNQTNHNQVGDADSENTKVTNSIAKTEIHHHHPTIQPQKILSPFKKEKQITFKKTIFTTLIISFLVNIILFYHFNSLERNLNNHMKLDEKLSRKFCKRLIYGSESDSIIWEKTSLLDRDDFIRAISIIQEAENSLKIAKESLQELIQKNSETSSVTN